MIYLQAVWPIIARAPGTFASHIKAAEERGKRIVTFDAYCRHHAAGVKGAANRERRIARERTAKAMEGMEDATPREMQNDRR